MRASQLSWRCPEKQACSRHTTEIYAFFQPEIACEWRAVMPVELQLDYKSSTENIWCTHVGRAIMQELNTKELAELVPEDVMDARDCLQLLLIEYGDTHIDTLAQLFELTNRVEHEFPHICAQRYCGPPRTVVTKAKVIHLRQQPA
jgi:hypothetical protein